MSSNCRLVSLRKVKAGNEEMLSPKSEPQSAIESLIGEPNSKELNPNTFHKMLSDQPIRKIITFLKQHRGCNSPIDYNPDFNFRQKWQSISKGSQHSKMSMDSLPSRYPWLNLLIMPFLVAQIWLLSVFRIFRFEDNQIVFIIGLIEQTSTFAYSIYSLFRLFDSRIDILSQFQSLLANGDISSLVSSLYCMIYYAIFTADVGSLQNNNQLSLLFLDWIAIGVLYMRIIKIYSPMRIWAIGSKHKNFMHLFDLISNIFIMIHLFSVLLYLCTYYNPDQNWLSNSPFQSLQNWLYQYLVSFYFACTTMLTVGYGDLRPTNSVEIMCILAVQLFGIINNGYAINQIGVNLAQMRAAGEALEQDISNAQKLAKFNRMEDNLRQKMCNYIVKNQQVNQQLSISEEQCLLNKLSEDLRQQIKQNNQIRVVKHSLFLISNFSKRLQLDVSHRLVKAIYPPNTTLPQIHGKQKLFILTKGSIDLLTEKKNKSRNYPDKLLKTLQVQQNNDNDVLDNVYGYSALLSGQQSRIKAIAKTFSVFYTVQHQDFLDCVINNDQDFQTFHALRDKYLLTHTPEKYETPNILTSRDHYNPNIFYLIRKRNKNKQTNIRKFGFRRNSRSKTVVQKFEQQIIHRSDSLAESIDSVQIEDNQVIQVDIKQKNSQFRRAISGEQNDRMYLNKPRAHSNRYRNNKKYQEMRLLKLQQKYNTIIKEQIYIEAFKEYKRYLPHGNITLILMRVNKGKLFMDQLKNNSRLDILRSKREEKNIRKCSKFG